ncbi:MAG: hypothetical protein WD512_17680, partial [Candidatus Paceibacterota bacterium]
MSVVILYDKKQQKTVNDNLIELDLDDLESFGNYRHGETFLKIPSMKVKGKTIVEWFALNDVSFWWFASPVIHPRFKEATLFIDRLSSFLVQNSVKTIILRGSYDKASIVKQICQLNNIRFETYRWSYLIFSVKRIITTFLKKFVYKRITQSKFKKRLKCYNKQGYEKLPQEYTLIVSPGLYRRETIDPESGKIKKVEFFLQPILDLLKKNNIPTLCMDVDYTFRGKVDVLKERLGTEYAWMPIEILLDKQKSNFVTKSVQSLKQSLLELKRGNINDIFIYKNIRLWQYLEPVFSDLFLEPYLPTFLHLIERMEEFLRETKPKVIIQLYETGPYAKAIELAARKLRIKTIGIQHGLIPSDTPDYIFFEGISETSHLGNIIPDRTFVFGEQYYRLLTKKSTYPPNRVSIIG